MSRVTFNRLGYVKVERIDQFGARVLNRKESFRVIRHFTRHLPGNFKIGETIVVPSHLEEVNINDRTG